MESIIKARQTTDLDHCARMGLSALIAILASLALSSCEQSDTGPALGVSPSSFTLDIETGSVDLTVGSGTTEGSLPLEWSVSNPTLGRIIRNEGTTATYARLADNGQNRVTVRDQYGVEGIAVITQVDSVTDTNSSSTTDSDTSAGAPSSALPLQDRIFINNFWDDGESFTTPQISAGTSSFSINVSDSEGRPGEEHSLSATDIIWSGSDITGFTVVFDGSVTLTYP